jgi:capsular polysaccharide biosynthesis protein
MELKVYLRAVRRRKWLPVVFAALAALSSVAFAAIAANPPLARATVLLYTQEPQAGPPDAFLSQQINAFLGLSKSDGVANEIIKAKDLDMSRTDLQDRLSSARVEDTSTVTLSYKGTSKKNALDVIDSYVDATVAAYQRTLREPVANLVADTQARIDALEPQLNEISVQIAEFEKAHGFRDLDAEKHAQVDEINSLRKQRNGLIVAGDFSGAATAERLISDRIEQYKRTSDLERDLSALIRKQQRLQSELNSELRQLENAREAEQNALLRVQVQPLGEPKLVERGITSIAVRTLLATILGAALGALLAIVLDLMDTSVRSIEEAEEIAGARVLAVIPDLPVDDRKVLAGSGAGHGLRR